MVSRRRILANVGGTGLLISLTGCIGTRWWEDDTDNAESSNSTGDNTNTPSSSDTQTDTEETHTDTSTDSADTNDRKETTENEENENRQHKPDEEDLEVNEDKYENHGSSETRERSPDDIMVKATAELKESGRATVTGTVTNASEEPIDVVDLEVSFYDKGGSYLTADLVSITNLDPNASESFEITITPDQARGEPDHIDIQPTVYDRSD